MINLLSGNNLPETTNVVMGELEKVNGEFKTLNVDITNAPENIKNIYDAFFQVVGHNAFLRIVNSPYQFDGNHVSPHEVAIEEVELDYNTMSVEDKAVIDDTFSFLESL